MNTDQSATPVHVADRLAASITVTGSCACVGLDPRVSLLPPTLIAQAQEQPGDQRQQIAWAFERFACDIIDAIAGHCAAVKPQVACYEAYGPSGMAALERIIQHADSWGIPVIVDGKRGDIGSTAQHYGQAWLGQAPGWNDSVIPGVGADWLTVNGYLGGDGVLPILPPKCGSRGVFVLVKTSNPGSGDLQDLALAGGNEEPVMHAMARLVAAWGADCVGTSGLSQIGAVVGATWPDQARQLRALMPNTLFLVPGYGAQGGTAADALAGQRADGSGVVVNSSRGIIGAWQQSDLSWPAAARQALDAMNDDLAAV